MCVNINLMGGCGVTKYLIHPKEYQKKIYLMTDETNGNQIVRYI